MADWKDFEINNLLPPAILNGVQTAISTSSTVVNAGLQILKILQVFLNVSSNPLTSSISLLLQQIQQLLDNIQETSVNALFLVPKSKEELAQNTGGFGVFRQKVISSFYDINDADRPRFGPSATMGGLVLYINQESAADLLQQLIYLYSFFNRDLEISYPAPIALKVEATDSFGDPLDSALLSIFEPNGPTPEHLFLSWREPRVANDIFLDIFARNKFYIERSKKREGELVTKESTNVKKEDPIEKQLREKYGNEKRVPDPLLNSKNQPVRYWEPLDPNDPFLTVQDALDDLASADYNFLAGTYGVLLEDVDPGIENGYYYRVTSVPKDVTLETKFQGPQGQDPVYRLELNGEVYTESKPSAPKFGFLPDIDTNFDLPSAVLNTYRAAYLLRFDELIYDANGNPLIGSESLTPIFPSHIINSTDEFTSISSTGPDGETTIVQYFTEGIVPPATNNKNLLTYSDSVRENSLDLVTDPQSFDPFGGVDEFLSPGTNQDPSERVRRTIDGLVRQKVQKLVPFLSANDSLFTLFQDFYQQAQPKIEEILLGDSLASLEITEETTREQIFLALQILEGNVEQGQPPNWTSINFLEDLLPEGDDLFNDVFALINSFDNIIRGTVGELQETIQSIEDRLAILNAIIDGLEIILDVLEELNQLGPDINLLWIDPQIGGVQKFISEFVSASNAPDRDPSDFYAGIVLTFGGEGGGGVTGIANALKLIFGT